MFEEVFFSSKLESIQEYLFYHDLLDRFVWLIKLMYAPKEIIKNRKYRADDLFQYYIKSNIKMTKIEKNISSKKNNNKEKFIYYLQQGWYNELSALYPFNKNQYSLGIQSYNSKSWNTELFPAWSVIQTYYSVYSFYNSLVFTNYDKINTFKHRNTTNSFNTSLLKKFSELTLFHPFNILCKDVLNNPQVFRKIEREEWQYQYALCPRSKYTYTEYPKINSVNFDEFDFTEIMEHQREKIDSEIFESTFWGLEFLYCKDLEFVQDRLKCKAPVNIVDALYLFRTWANYSGGETVFQLQKGGYLKYLEKNLFAINYFIAGIAELTAIGFLGADKYLEVFNDFYSKVIKTKDEFYGNWSKLPFLNRLRIFEHFQFVDKIDKNNYIPKNDNFSFIDLG